MRNVLMWVLIITFYTAISLMFISQKEHIFAKIFRRGKGIPESELKAKGCLRNPPEVFLVSRLLRDPRLNESQKLQIIEDVYQENLICPFGDQEIHDSRKNEFITKEVISPGILGKSAKKLTPEMLFLIIKELPPYKESALFSTSIISNDYNRHREAKSIELFLTNSRIGKEAFGETFDKLILFIDTTLKSYNNKFELSKDFCNSILSILNKSIITNEEVSALAYSNMGWLRKIVILSPKCSQAGKVVASLMNGSVRAKN